MSFFKRNSGISWFYFFEKWYEAECSKILALKEAKRPQDIKGVCRYLGIINYLKHFIPDFSTLTYPICKLTHQDIKFEWSENCGKSFQTLNNYLTERAVNTYFDEKKNTVIYCDQSPVGLSSILLQKD